MGKKDIKKNNKKTHMEVDDNGQFIFVEDDAPKIKRKEDGDILLESNEDSSNIDVKSEDIDYDEFFDDEDELYYEDEPKPKKNPRTKYKEAKYKKKTRNKYFPLLVVLAILMVGVGGYFGFRAYNLTRLNHKAEDYMNNQMYDEAEATYQKIGVQYKNENVKPKLELINNLRQSSAAYAEGIRLYNSGKDQEAVTQLSKVIKEDKANYADAQSIIKIVNGDVVPSEPSKDGKDTKDDKDKNKKDDKDKKEEKVVTWDYSSASSALSEGGYVHSSKLALDPNTSTNWTPESETGGVGEWIKIEAGQERDITKVELYGGNYKNEYWYNANNRIKKIKLEFSDGSSQDFMVEESFPKPAELKLKSPVKTRSIKFTILDVYKGNKYNDAPISVIKAYSSIDKKEVSDKDN